jgi:hypothetical protein
VFNPSFETHSVCPSTLSSNGDDQVSRINGWSSSNNTPDFYDVCSTTSITSVPKNVLGYQYAYDGTSYTGIVVYNKNTFFRETISSKLTNSLTIGVKYFISFKISLAEDVNYNFCGINKVGLLLSTKKYDLINTSPINNFAHIYSSNIDIDTINWKTISGVIVADSNYQYVNIGNFFDDSNINYSVLNSVASDSYYYIDDIRISTDSILGLALKLNEKTYQETGIKVYPNPTTDKILIKSLHQIQKIFLFDEVGKEIIGIERVETLDLSHLQNGFYFLKIEYNNSQTVYKKVIKT